ncbi:MAG: hypothetical protein JKX81_16410 [Arenicella sp.]|nr:hypothetical protein [Arenicella sp.]
MSDAMKWLWQFNLDLSLLLISILLARAALRRLTGTYNNYLLWLSIPLAVVVTSILSTVELSSAVTAQIQPLQSVVHDYVIQPREMFDAWSVIGLSIAVLTALLIMRLMLQHRNLRRELRRISDNEHAPIQSSFPVISVTKDGFSPAVYGFLYPTIYFPLGLAKSLPPSQIALIIAHEEQHIRQGHLWLNLLWDVLVCVLWFNPLVYLARQGFRHDQEMYCDYLVLKNSDPHDRRKYGHALLSTVSATHSVSLLCSWKMFNQLEERIMNIKTTFSKPKKLLITFFSTVLVSTASVYSLAMAEDSDSKDTKKIVIIDNGQKHKIKVIQDGLTYLDEGGEKSIVENGKRRALTPAEEAKYEALIDQIDIEQVVEIEHDGSHNSSHRGSHRIISILRSDGDQDNVELSHVLQNLGDLKELASLHGLQQVKHLDALEALKHIDIEVLSNIDGSFAIAEHELAQALHSIESVKENEHLNKAEIKKTVKELKSLQKQLAKDKKRTQKTHERARLAAENVKVQVQRGAH